MNKNEYQAYLHSPEWQIRRSWALARAGYRCQVCNAAGLLDVHHRTYERVTREHPDDVTVLCRDCHARYHGKKTPEAVAHAEDRPPESVQEAFQRAVCRLADAKQIPPLRMFLRTWTVIDHGERTAPTNGKRPPVWSKSFRLVEVQIPFTSPASEWLEFHPEHGEMILTAMAYELGEPVWGGFTLSDGNSAEAGE